MALPIVKLKEPIPTLLTMVQQGYRGPSWHGPNLRATLRGVDAQTAAWRPGPKRNSIWELALHAAYWKYRVYRWLTEAPPRSFGIPGSNFFRRPAKGCAWPDELELLEAWHEHLVKALVAFEPGRLGQTVGKNRFTYADLVNGVAAHDVYHAGQIQLIKRLRGL